MAFTTGCRDVSAPACGAPLPAPHALTLVSAGLFLSHLLTPFSHTCCALFTLSLICYHRGTTSITHRLSLASRRLALELARTGSVRYGGSSWSHPTETLNAPATKPCHINQIQSHTSSHRNGNKTFSK